MGAWLIWSAKKKGVVIALLIAKVQEVIHVIIRNLNFTDYIQSIIQAVNFGRIGTGETCF